MKQLFIFFILIINTSLSYSQNRIYSGNYSYGTVTDSGSIGDLQVKHISDSTYSFSLTIVNGPPSFNNGDISGVIAINKMGNAKFNDQDSTDNTYSCKINFTFHNKKVFLSSQSKSSFQCGFGHNVNPTGVYIKKRKPLIKK